MKIENLEVRPSGTVILALADLAPVTKRELHILLEGKATETAAAAVKTSKHAVRWLRLRDQARESRAKTAAAADKANALSDEREAAVAEGRSGLAVLTRKLDDAERAIEQSQRDEADLAKAAEVAKDKALEEIGQAAWDVEPSAEELQVRAVAARVKLEYLLADADIAAALHEAVLLSVGATRSRELRIRSITMGVSHKTASPADSALAHWAEQQQSKPSELATAQRGGRCHPMENDHDAI